MARCCTLRLIATASSASIRLHSSLLSNQSSMARASISSSARSRSAIATPATARRLPTTYVCSECGADAPKWSGQCTHCEAWNSLTRFTQSHLKSPLHSSPSHFRSGGNGSGGAASSRSWVVRESATGKPGELTPVNDVAPNSRSDEPLSLGSPELDRLLGGGLVAGSVILLGGPPGCGKSTLAMQICAMLAQAAGCNGMPYSAQFCRNSSSAPPVSARHRKLHHQLSEAHAAGESFIHTHPTPSHPSMVKVAYISGEESPHQLKGRVRRLGIEAPGLLVMNETNLDTILAQIEAASPPGAVSTNPTDNSLACVVIDSVQTMWLDTLPGAAGSVSQVRDVALRLTQYAKATGTPVILIGHVTKSNDLAGPRVLEHIVDVVLHVDSDASSGGGGGGGADLSSAAHSQSWSSSSHESTSSSSPIVTASEAQSATSHVRMIRSTKNRFGATDTAILALGSSGFTECDPARIFLSRYRHPSKRHSLDGSPDAVDSGLRAASDADDAEWTSSSGCTATVTLEGSRALCVEIQALTSPPVAAFPRQRTVGLSSDRLSMLLAVLAKHTIVRSRKPHGYDVLASVVGGLRLSDTCADVALAVAVTSSLLNLPVPLDVLCLGEIGLGGELRSTGHMRLRINTAQRLGFTRVFVPAEGSFSTSSAASAGGGFQPASLLTGGGAAAAAAAGGAFSSGIPTSTMGSPPPRASQFQVIPVRSLNAVIEALFGEHCRREMSGSSSRGSGRGSSSARDDEGRTRGGGGTRYSSSNSSLGARASWGPAAFAGRGGFRRY